MSTNKDLVLRRGQNLAPSYQSVDFSDFLIGITHYKDPVETGLWHAHENPMISFVLYGHNMEYGSQITPHVQRLPRLWFRSVGQLQQLLQMGYHLPAC